MLNVKISIDDNKGKKVEVEISEADNLSKLVIIQNVFNLFGISTDVMEMTKMYNKAGKAYSDFFNQVNPIEVTEKKAGTLDTKVDPELIKQQLTEGLTTNKDELEATYKEKNDNNVPEFVRTGIKIDPDGVKRYRCHYKCTACWNRGNHFIFVNSTSTWCHRCQHELVVQPAHPEGFPNKDSFGNFFSAGEFRDWSMEWD